MLDTEIVGKQLTVSEHGKNLVANNVKQMLAY